MTDTKKVCLKKKVCTSHDFNKDQMRRTGASMNRTISRFRNNNSTESSYNYAGMSML